MVTQLGLLGEFIPLERAIWAISRHASVSDSQIEAQVGLDFQEDDPTIVSIHKAAIRLRLSRAQAASDLLRVLNRKPEHRPEWHELIRGIALRDDRVGKIGLEWLCAVAQTSLPDLAPVKADEASTLANPALPTVQTTRIGFNRGELMEALDREGIKHALHESKAPNQAHDVGAEAVLVAVPKRTEIMGSTFGAQRANENHGEPALSTVTTVLSTGAAGPVFAKKKRHKSAPAGPDILKAQRRVEAEGGDRFECGLVWPCLREMAKTGNLLMLFLDASGELMTRASEKPTPYLRATLAKHLLRERTRLQEAEEKRKIV